MDHDPGRPADGGRIAPDLGADPIERCEPWPELVDVGALLRVAAPDVGVARGVELTLGPVAVDQDRDRVRAGTDRCLREVTSRVPGALEVGMTAAQQRDDDLERFLEPVEDAVLRQAEGVSLTRPGVTGTEPEHESPAADLVEGLGSLGDDPRVAVERRNTQVPTLAVEVTAATAPAIETPSHIPRGGPSLARHRSSSGVQIVSKPTSSARRARSRMTGQRTMVWSARSCMMGNITPISNVRMTGV